MFYFVMNSLTFSGYAEAVTLIDKGTKEIQGISSVLGSDVCPNDMDSQLKSRFQHQLAYRGGRFTVSNEFQAQGLKALRRKIE